MRMDFDHILASARTRPLHSQDEGLVKLPTITVDKTRHLEPARRRQIASEQRRHGKGASTADSDHRDRGPARRGCLRKNGIAVITHVNGVFPLKLI